MANIGLNMIESQEQLQSVFNTMKLNINFDFIPKFTKCIASYIGNCIDKVVRHQKDAITKRLRKRRHRLFVGCKHRSDKIKCKCDCKRCTKYKQIPKRSISRTDFIRNFICSNRPAEDVILTASTDRNQMSCMDNDRAHSWSLTQKQTQDHRDVYFIIYFSYLIFTWVACLTAKFIFHVNWTVFRSRKCCLPQIPIKS